MWVIQGFSVSYNYIICKTQKIFDCSIFMQYLLVAKWLTLWKFQALLEVNDTPNSPVTYNKNSHIQFYIVCFSVYICTFFTIDKVFVYIKICLFALLTCVMLARIANLFPQGETFTSNTANKPQRSLVTVLSTCLLSTSKVKNMTISHSVVPFGWLTCCIWSQSGNFLSVNVSCLSDANNGINSLRNWLILFINIL